MINIKKLPNPSLIMELYKRYYMQDETPQKFLSTHWKDYSKKIEVKIDTEDNLKIFLGYGFGDLQYTKFYNRIINYLCNLSYFIRLPNKKEIMYLCKKSVSSLKLIESYLSYDCFRQIIAFSIIQNYLNVKKDEGFNVIIIGDGYGFFSSLIKNIYPKSKILLVDIGKVLFFQCANLQRIFPLYNHVGTIEEGSFSRLERSDFIYCPAEKIEKIVELRYKLIINISSMQEMNIETINKYFNYIRKYATENNLFYCSNRLFKRLPGGEELYFYNYPWYKEDKHIIDEEPKFYRYFFSTRFPFIHRFDGVMRHRLTNIFLNR